MALVARHRHDVTADEFFAMADRLPPTAQLITLPVADLLA